MDIRQKLFELRDADYAAFEAKLTPTIPAQSCIGVRMPVLRKLEREIRGTTEARAFVEALPHAYYDENMLHALLLCTEKDFGKALAETEEFLPYVDNWAVCDTLVPAVFAKHRAELMQRIPAWIASSEAYTCRFGIGMLMHHFLDEDFKAEYLEIPASVRSDEYYVNMMIAWFFATALAKQYNETVVYLSEKRLPGWVHNKTIQKAVESFRVDGEKKAYLKSLRVARK